MSTISQGIKQEKFKKGVLFVSIIAFVFSSSVFFSGVLKGFELKFYDILQKYFNTSKKFENICMVYIDQGSIEELSKQSINWPWPRQIYAPVLEYLSHAEAVFLDLLFTENSSYGVEDDRILADALKKAGNVYLPVVLSREKREFNRIYLERISVQNLFPTSFRYNSVIFPIDELSTNAKGLGNVGVMPDEDGIYRKVPLFFEVNGYTVPNFVMSYFFKRDLIKLKDGKILIDKAIVPITEGNLLLKFSRDENPFTVFSFLQLLNASTVSKENSSIKREFFKGKTVFIGPTAAGLFDLKPTPVSSKTPGVFIHATNFENLWSKDFIRKAPNFIVFTIILLISFFIPLSFLRHYSIKFNLFVFLSVLIFLFAVEVILFRHSVYMEFLPSLTTLVFTSIISLLYSYAVEGRERSFIKRTFTQYMDQKIVEYLLSNPESIAPGGHKKFVTVMFADIAGFTSISEKLTAEQTAMMLHRVLNRLTEVVINHGGVVDKYIGDCIMAFWGSPIKNKDDENNACKCALECIDSLREINRLFSEQGLPEIKIRIGMHTGEAIVGNIGSDRLFNYTVIGDTVNIASRLESVNKFFGSSVIISEDTFSKISLEFVSRQLGFITVKGKTKPVKIFEILGEKEKLTPDKVLSIEKFNRAYHLFMEKKWKESREIFEEILRDFPDDVPAKFYLQRIDELSSSEQLTEDWFVVKMKEK